MEEGAVREARRLLTPRLRGRQLAVGLTRFSHPASFDFDLEAGECLAVTGPSGSGKSLFLRMIADLDPHEGELWLDGVSQMDISGPAWRSNVLYCPADSGWWSEQVCDHMPDTAFTRTVAEQMGLISATFSTPISRFSTGERQRLALVRALCRTPRVLLLDEPTSALDMDTTLRVENVLRERMTEGVSMILVSHDQAQISRLAGRCFRMEQGRLGIVT